MKIIKNKFSFIPDKGILWCKTCSSARKSSNLGKHNHWAIFPRQAFLWITEAHRYDFKQRALTSDTNYSYIYLYLTSMAESPQYFSTETTLLADTSLLDRLTFTLPSPDIQTEWIKFVTKCFSTPRMWSANIGNKNLFHVFYAARTSGERQKKKKKNSWWFLRLTR